ncbi:hypothetical protein vBPaeMUSP18_51 [Pseudomonas phage vB_PaeM_USP_18]|nr:hypothetical protein vBPaeMUSP18_51 [Pseudomonas phage vB_PaeM_USP_18]QLI49524.1 hypothetical protein vBPaeMUSP25_51 [Pseudomonas phage vB_PaeM_USP_25]
MTKKSLPDAKRHRPDPQYTAELVELAKQRAGLSSQAAVAERIGVGLSTLKDWKSGTASMSYPDQYALERLAGVV